MIKLIVTDLDGSLLNDEKQIPEDFWDLEKSLHQQGVIFAIASGRPLQNIAMEFEAIKNRTYFISDNGSYMVYQNEELLVTPLGKQVVDEFVAISRPLHNVFPVLCGRHTAYLEDDNEQLLKITSQYYQEYKIVNNAEDVNDQILKISMCDFGDPYTNSYPLFKKYRDKYKVAVAGERWLDLTDFNADKGNAVRQLQQRLNISYDETMVFGDYPNDLQLMKAGKYSFAMRNAQPEIIQAASFITALDNNNGGVVETIKAYMPQMHTT